MNLLFAENWPIVQAVAKERAALTLKMAAEDSGVAQPPDLNLRSMLSK